MPTIFCVLGKQGSTMSIDTLALGTEISIRNIQPLYQKLLELLHRVDELILDAGELHKVDTAGAQLLYLFALSCDKRGLKLSWQQAQPAFIAQLTRLGIRIPTLDSDFEKETLNEDNPRS